MSGWVVWVLGVLAVSIVATTMLSIRCLLQRADGRRTEGATEKMPGDDPHQLFPEAAGANVLLRRQRILIVDDDPLLRLVLRTTLTADEYIVEEAASAEEARALARFWQPAFVVLDVGLPDQSGLTLCDQLKHEETFGAPRVVLLTGADIDSTEAQQTGADGLLHKPFSPLELLSMVERLGGPDSPVSFSENQVESERDQLVAYAQDLGRLLQIERAQRRLLQRSYRQTVVALADALEAKDPITGIHASRVQRYALELTAAADSSLLDDPTLEYGFLLHDIGKIGVPDAILKKAGPLDLHEQQLMQRHPVIGAGILREIALLKGEGIRVVRSHHERWDGRGYPDRLAEREIPLGARIFAVADALDAMTSDRPYRSRRPWDEAVDEILAQDGSQFDPRAVAAFAVREAQLRRIHDELVPNVA
jgi:cyclic di-GMP phosphodiesterase